MASSPPRLTPADIAERIKAHFGDDVPEAADVLDQAVVRIMPARYRELITLLRDDADLDFDFFDFSTAVDLKEEGFDVVTQLFSNRHHHHVRVKVRCDRESPSCPSVHELYPGANWFERETWELFGIDFEGHPQLVKLVLPEQFEGHPLRKDFVLTTRMAKPWPGEEKAEGPE